MSHTKTTAGKSLKASILDLGSNNLTMLMRQYEN